MKRTLVVASLIVNALVYAATPASTEIQMYGVKLLVPAGWQVAQQATSGEISLVGLSKGTAYVTFYAAPGTGVALKSLFSKEAKVTAAETSEVNGPFSWRVMESTRQLSFQSENKLFFVKGFLAELGKHTYYGFSRAGSAQEARKAAEEVQSSLVTPPIESLPKEPNRSLTASSFLGKKYYFGWGAADFFDPSNMKNEVKYDVLHTHDIFTKEVGGNYIGETLIRPKVATGKTIRKVWSDLRAKITPEDMYVQYSSGHGSETGLMAGVTYQEIRDFALALPAREIVIFTMACHSGGLVDSFNQKKTDWQDWKEKGRTLLVLASSRTSETSGLGPGTDPGEPGGAKGTAGSAFGHALWKALVGESDGFLDGVKDGFVSLGEIRDYTRYRTYQLANHLPVETGTYEPGVIMNRVPSREFLTSLEGGSENLTDDQILRRIQELDHELRVTSQN